MTVMGDASMDGLSDVGSTPTRSTWKDIFQMSFTVCRATKKAVTKQVICFVTVFLIVQVLNPPGSGKDRAEGKGSYLQRRLH